MRRSTLWIWLSPVLLSFTLIGFFAARAMHARETEGYWDLETAEQIRALVSREYVDDISDEEAHRLFYAAMQGYLEALDPYCSFYDPEERRRMEEDTSGQFGGVGILVRVRDAELVIVGLRRADPAEQAGVEMGDVIVSVDGKSVADLKMEEITPLIRGRPGTPVVMGLRRGDEFLERKLIRSDIKMDSVIGVRILDEDHGVGYFRVNSFQENTGEQAARAIRHLEERGAHSFVLDLRQNTGGVLEKGAVALVDLFLTEGPIVETRGRIPGSRRIYGASSEGTLCPNAPLVVLVDGGSASAAEVVAGAFQDRRRAILLGERTYGKFLVQSIHRMARGDVAIALTTARYYTPYGRWLQRNDKQSIRGGLVPDVVIERTEEETRRLLMESFANQHGLKMLVDEEVDPEADLRAADPQLARALEMLADYEEIK